MFDLFLHPERRRPGPQPLQVDLRRTIVAGIALWCAGAVVLAVLAIGFDVDVQSKLVICATGLGLGLLALVWEHTNRRRYRAVAETRDVVDLPDDAASPPA